MNQNWLYVLLFLLSFTESKIALFNLTNTIPKDKEKYHPFKIRFDFSKMKQSKNIGLVEKLDNMLSQVSKVFSQIFNTLGKFISFFSHACKNIRAVLRKSP